MKTIQFIIAVAPLLFMGATILAFFLNQYYIAYLAMIATVIAAFVFLLMDLIGEAYFGW